VDDATRQHNAELFGIWTLVPPVVAIALAFITKEVILSLFIGAFSGTDDGSPRRSPSRGRG